MDFGISQIYFGRPGASVLSEEDSEEEGQGCRFLSLLGGLELMCLGSRFRESTRVCSLYVCRLSCNEALSLSSDHLVESFDLQSILPYQ